MSMIFNVAEAKARLSELIALAEKGEEVVIARGGKPAVRVVPVNLPPVGTRRLGILAHLGSAPDIDVFLERDEELEAWAEGVHDKGGRPFDPKKS